jgi:hypothetical protein
MKFAYADPPYLGSAHFYKALHPDALVWNDPATHRRLITDLLDGYPDGWALSASSSNLRTLLPICPDDVRVMAWCKPWAKWLPGLSPAYSWEPVIMRGGRKIARGAQPVRDWHVGNHPPRINLPDGFVPGMKPRAFCRWVFAALNALSGDELDDMFPGSGAVTAAWAEWVGEKDPLPPLPLLPAERPPQPNALAGATNVR